MQLDERREPLGEPADDRERHRQAERAGAERRLRRAADGDPDRQRILHRPRIDAEVRRSAHGAGPPSVTRSALAELDQQLSFSANSSS